MREIMTESSSPTRKAAASVATPRSSSSSPLFHRGRRRKMMVEAELPHPPPRRSSWKVLAMGCCGLLLVSVCHNYIYYTRKAFLAIHPADLEHKNDHGTLQAFWFPPPDGSSSAGGKKKKRNSRYSSSRHTTRQHHQQQHQHHRIHDDEVTNKRQEKDVSIMRLQDLVEVVMHEHEKNVATKEQRTHSNSSRHYDTTRDDERDERNYDNNVYGYYSEDFLVNHGGLSNTIRSWGCDLTQTPLIYIHVGKAGGGQVRARFAASAVNFPQLLQHEKEEEQQQQLQNNTTKKNAGNWFRRANNRAYFLVQDESENHQDHAQQQHETATHSRHGRENTNDRRDKRLKSLGPAASTNEPKRVYFCNSRHTNFRVHDIDMYEGSSLCHAKTPIGQAVACPERLERMIGDDDGCYGCGDPTSPHCRVVYMGHNLFGNEMHWLPSKYLSNWWATSPWRQEQNGVAAYKRAGGVIEKDPIDSYLETLMPDDNAWCPFYNLSRPIRHKNDVYLKCSVPLAPAVDEHAARALMNQRDHHQEMLLSYAQDRQQQQVQEYKDLHEVDWSSLYASLPVLRTTILREPFSWLLSRFFWHANDNYFSCDDMDAAGEQQQQHDGAPDAGELCQIQQTHGRGWAHRYALLYIFYLCGEDCAARYEMSCSNNDAKSNQQLLAQMERQAANNLRQSFAVVGLLNETDTFYDMVTARVQYLNMSLHASLLDQDVEDRRHSTAGGKEQKRCKALYKDVAFQEKFIDSSPAVAALDRLFRIGVEVNRFQIKELEQCNAK